MPSQLNPYVTFEGNARAAMDFYNDVLGGTLRLSTFGEYGDKDAPGADRIMHGVLESDAGFTLMGADLPPGEVLHGGHNISLSISGDDGADLRGYFARLAEGGTITVPLEKQMWGDEFGMCTDRYGLVWMVNITASSF